MTTLSKIFATAGSVVTDPDTGKPVAIVKNDLRHHGLITPADFQWVPGVKVPERGEPISDTPGFRMLDVGGGELKPQVHIARKWRPVWRVK